MAEENTPTEVQKEEVAQTTGQFTEPKVVLIVGNSVRRLHALMTMASSLDSFGHPMYMFTTSVNKKEAQKINKKTFPVPFEQYSKKSFQSAYKSFLRPSNKESYIVIEMSYGVMRSFNFKQHNVDTVIFTDILFPERDVIYEVQDYLIGQLRKNQKFTTIIYNDDIVSANSVRSKWIPLDVEHIPVRNHYSYGVTTESGIDFSPTEDKLLVTMPNIRMNLEFDKDFSIVKREGYFGGLSALLLDRVFTTPEYFTVPKSFPYLEEKSGESHTFIWPKYFSGNDEMLSVMMQYDDICMGVKTYLRFERLIENAIAEFHHVVVVAENSNEEEVMTEYFLKKEANSYHTIIFIPEARALKDLQESLFGTDKVAFLFDELDHYDQLEHVIKRDLKQEANDAVKAAEEKSSEDMGDTLAEEEPATKTEDVGT